MRSAGLCAVTEPKSHSGMLINDLRLRIIPESRFGMDAHVYAIDGNRLADRDSFAASCYVGRVAHEGCARHPFRGAAEVRIELYTGRNSFPFRPAIMRSAATLAGRLG